MAEAKRCGDPRELGVKVVVGCPEGSKPQVCIEEGKPLEVSCIEQGQGGG